MSNKKIIQHAIEHLYGPCPVGDFVRANEWVSHLDWEKIKQQVDADNPDFEWTHDESNVSDAAESLITEVRHEILHRAGETEL